MVPFLCIHTADFTQFLFVFHCATLSSIHVLVLSLSTTHKDKKTFQCIDEAPWEKWDRVPFGPVLVQYPAFRVITFQDTWFPLKFSIRNSSTFQGSFQDLPSTQLYQADKCYRSNGSKSVPTNCCGQVPSHSTNGASSEQSKILLQYPLKHKFCALRSSDNSSMLPPSIQCSFNVGQLITYFPVNAHFFPASVLEF